MVFSLIWSILAGPDVGRIVHCDYQLGEDGIHSECWIGIGFKASA